MAVSGTGTDPSSSGRVSDDWAGARSANHRTIEGRAIDCARRGASGEVPQSAGPSTSDGHKRPASTSISRCARHKRASARKYDRRVPREGKRRAPVRPGGAKGAQCRRHGQGHAVKMGWEHELHKVARRGAAQAVWHPPLLPVSQRSTDGGSGTASASSPRTQ